MADNPQEILSLISQKAGGNHEHIFYNKTAFPITKNDVFNRKKIHILLINNVIVVVKNLFFGDWKRSFDTNQWPMGVYLILR